MDKLWLLIIPLLVLLHLGSATRTLAEIQTYRKGICTQPSQYGDCSRYVKKWFFDVLHYECRQFIYSQCGGNQNRFDSRDKCMAFCQNPRVAINYSYD